MNSSVEDQIRQIEYEWGEAFERGDMATLDRLMADEYVVTDPLGNVRSKAESLAAIQSREVFFRKYHKRQRTGARQRRYGNRYG